MKLEICLIFIVFLSFTFALNERPIIGVLTQFDDSYTCQKLGKGNSYIAASYIKYLESGHTGNDSYFMEMFNNINGVLFPGGDASLNYSSFWNAGSFFYNQSIAAFEKGDIFPIEGHCLGFELLCVLTSQNTSILSSRILDGVSLPLDLLPAYKTSRWLGNAPSNIIEILSTKNVTLNNHDFGLPPDTFNNTEKLYNFYTALSTNLDKFGRSFISSFESKKYPIYGTQFHAEKPQFEWNPTEAINHSAESILAMQYYANYLVTQARQNTHKFSNQQNLYNTLIYNYNPVYSEKYIADFEQMYCFDL